MGLMTPIFRMINTNLGCYPRFDFTCYSEGYVDNLGPFSYTECAYVRSGTAADVPVALFCCSSSALFLLGSRGDLSEALAAG